MLNERVQANLKDSFVFACEARKRPVDLTNDTEKDGKGNSEKSEAADDPLKGDSHKVDKAPPPPPPGDPPGDPPGGPKKDKPWGP